MSIRGLFPPETNWNSSRIEETNCVFDVDTLLWRSIPAPCTAPIVLRAERGIHPTQTALHCAEAPGRSSLPKMGNLFLCAPFSRSCSFSVFVYQSVILLGRLSLFRALEAHPTINDELPHRIMIGAVQVRPEVTSLSGNTAHFADSTQVFAPPLRSI